MASAATASAATASISGATSPDRSWAGIDRVAVLCQVQGRLLQPGTPEDRLCAQVIALAARNSPVPIEKISYGRALTQPPRTAMLLVHGAIDNVQDQPMLAFTIRRDRSGGVEPRPIFFGAAPRVAPYSDTAAGNAALEGALSASLSEVLPWLKPAAESGELSPILKERM